MRRFSKCAILTPAMATFLLAGSGVAAAEQAEKHPNLFLNREEIEQIKTKVNQQPWAASLLEELTARAQKENPNQAGLSAASVYTLTGDRFFGDYARRQLLGTAHSWLPKYAAADLRIHPPFGSFAFVSFWSWSYDLMYDTLSAEERATVQKLLRAGAHAIIEGERHISTTPNLVFDKHWQVGVIGFCLGDQKLIDWALSDPGAHGPNLGGFYPVMDTMIAEGRFWKEAPIYALVYD